MKTIGLLGGTGWSSTIVYYKALNELIAQRLGGYHSAKIILKSIDYHDIMSHYGKDHERIARILKQELQGLIDLKPDCVIICCSSLHKYYDMVRHELESQIPVLHAIELVAQHLLKNKKKTALLLAARFTMEDGFFARILEGHDIKITIPSQNEREQMQAIHEELLRDIVTEESRDYFSNLIKKYPNLDAVILGCTEYPLVLDSRNSELPIIDPIYLQAKAAVDYALKES